MTTEPTADRATVLLEAAQHLYTALFPAVYDDMGQKAAEGVQRAVSELRRLAAEAPTTTRLETEPTAEEVARANVLALHQIGEQLAGIESWMWEHLANVRDTAKTQPEERPRCPHCQMPHDLTPGSLPVAVCESISQRIADGERLHSEGDHRLCARVDCEVLREQPAAGVRQDGAQPS